MKEINLQGFLRIIIEQKVPASLFFMTNVAKAQFKSWKTPFLALKETILEKEGGGVLQT